MSEIQTSPDQNQQRMRQRVRRTVMVLATVAIGIYVAFILSGVLGK